MFTSKVEHETTARLKWEGSVIPVDIGPYFWMNSLVSTTHSRVSQEVLQRFADFLASRGELSFVKEWDKEWKPKWTVQVDLRVRKDGGEWIPYRAESPLKLRGITP